MVALLALLFIAIAFGILVLDAWLLGIAVPLLEANPSHLGAWLLVLIVLAQLLGSYSLVRNEKR